MGEADFTKHCKAANSTLAWRRIGTIVEGSDHVIAENLRSKTSKWLQEGGMSMFPILFKQKYDIVRSLQETLFVWPAKSISSHLIDMA